MAGGGSTGEPGGGGVQTDVHLGGLFKSLRRALSGKASWSTSSGAKGKGAPLTNPPPLGPRGTRGVFNPHTPTAAPAVPRTDPTAPSGQVPPDAARKGPPSRKGPRWCYGPDGKRKKCDWLDWLTAHTPSLDAFMGIRPGMTAEEKVALQGVWTQNLVGAIGGMAPMPRTTPPGPKQITKQIELPAGRVTKQSGFVAPPVTRAGVNTKLPEYGPSAQRRAQVPTMPVGAVSLPFDELVPVEVTAVKVGRISPPLSDDRYALADAVGDTELLRYNVDRVTDSDITMWEDDIAYLNAFFPATGTAPGLGQRAAIQGTPRGTRPARQPASSTATPKRSGPLARAALGASQLLVESLLRAAVPKSGRAAVGRISLPAQSPFPGTGAPAPAASPAFLTPFGYAPARTRTKSKSDECECEKPKKKRKPRQPRSVCYRGSYRQTARGIKYKKIETIPCIN